MNSNNANLEQPDFFFRKPGSLQKAVEGIGQETSVKEKTTPTEHSDEPNYREGGAD